MDEEEDRFALYQQNLDQAVEAVLGIFDYDAASYNPGLKIGLRKAIDRTMRVIKED